MTNIACAGVRDHLPDLVRGDLPDEECVRIEKHVSACASCEAEVAVLRRIRSSPPTLPEGLAAEIKMAVAHDRARAGRSLDWRIPAAAAVVLALGTALVWQRAEARLQDSELAQESFLMVSFADDAVVGDAPVLEHLSEEELAILLEELGG